MVKRKCKVCGKEFKPTNQQIKNGTGKYCSPKCYHKSQIGTKRPKQSKAMSGKRNPNYNKKGKKNPLFGTKHSKETREKISKALTGHTVSKEQREKQGKTMSGKGNPFWGKKRPEHAKAISGKNNPWYGTHLTKEIKEKMKGPRLSVMGKKNPAWLGGKSFEPYGIKFNDKLKRAIRKRDNHTCQECGKKEKKLRYKLSIHHIDYNKKNHNPNNLISLCMNCHLNSNLNRKKWTKHFQKKIKEMYKPTI